MFGVAGLLGAAVVVLPAMAVEANPTIQAENFEEGGYGKHRWTPAQASVAPGGAVTLSNNSTTVPHGVEWVSTPGGVKPDCTGVPVGTTEAASGTKWSGSCTFTTTGTYRFYCTVHGPEMSGTIAVGSEGTTTTTTTTGTTTQPGSTPGVPTGAPGSGSPAAGSGSLLVGSASSAVKLAGTQHGHSVHGSVVLSSASSGGTLEVRLLAGRASLASAAHPTNVLVGRIVRTSLRPGRATFAVTLNSKAKHALHVHGHLALSVRIVLSSAHGAKLTLTRGVVLRG